MKDFAETGLQEELLKAVQDLGFETPTPIQAKTIPHLINTNKDLIALAQTGTGKTAAFGLPAIHLTDIDNRSTQTIVLCPTRELCLQITRDLANFSKYLPDLNVVAVYGGSSIDTQIRALKRGAQIVVGTPGRTKDLIKRRKLFLGNVERVILDEADEMLTMGFKEDLEEILAETPDEKQTLLFSATMSRDISRIAKRSMNDPDELSVAKINIGAENVTHYYYTVNHRDRYEVLKRVADINPSVYGIVFCRTRRETQEVANNLMQDGYNADALHGDLSQAQRDEVMGRFRSKHLQILVATDVASRGLDVNDLTHVINYNLPDDPEVYTHRSGRTGRAGKTGISIAVVTGREQRRIRDIERISGIKFNKELVPSGRDICKVQLLSLIDRIKKVEVDEQQIEPFLEDIYEKLEGLSREELIQHFVSSEFNRFLEYYKNARDINASDRDSSRDSRRGRDRDRRRERDRDRGRRRDRDRGRDGERRRRRDDDSSYEREPRREKRSIEERRRSKFSRLFINLGSKNDLNPSRLIGIINESLDSSDSEIGKIEILKRFSFFEIEEKMESRLIGALHGQKVDGVDLQVEVSTPKPAGAFSPKEKRPKSSGFGRKRVDKYSEKTKRIVGNKRRKK